MNSVRYIEVLTQCLLPYLRANFRRHADALFQQDGATCHTARIVKEWLRRHNIELLTWPAKSADLSPIENLWSCLARKVEERQPRTAGELTTSIQEEWCSLDVGLITLLLDSLPCRVQEVIDANGF